MEINVETNEFQGREGRIRFQSWRHRDPRYVAVIAHGYGEHIGRYEALARVLNEHGADVWGPDHIGHGQSDGERAICGDFETFVDDLFQVVQLAANTHRELPIVLIGHSMGGAIATRYAQRYGNTLSGLVLSGPAIGISPLIDSLLQLPEIPEIPIDPSTLSRDLAVGAAYAADPLVYHGPFKRGLLHAFHAARAAIATGPGFGSLPTLFIHGSDDLLVPLEETRPAIERLKGSNFTERIYEGARHEVFNEINRDEVFADVLRFVDGVVR